MNWDNLKQGDIIKVPQSYNWGRGPHVVDIIKDDHAWIVTYADDNAGAGKLERVDYRNRHFVRRMTDAERDEFNAWVKANF